MGPCSIGWFMAGWTPYDLSFISTILNSMANSEDNMESKMFAMADNVDLEGLGCHLPAVFPQSFHTGVIFSPTWPKH